LLARKEEDSSLLNPLLPRENAANPFLIPFSQNPVAPRTEMGSEFWTQAYYWMPDNKHVSKTHHSVISFVLTLQNPKNEVVACGAPLKRTNFKPPTQ
jgi:hypothetical protein